MHAASFEQENIVLDPAEGDEELVYSLCACQTHHSDGTPCVMSCWKPSKEELEEIIKTGRVWLTILGHRMPPVRVDGFSPFEDKPLVGGEE